MENKNTKPGREVLKSPAEIGFTCIICGEHKDLEGPLNNLTTPICKQCLKDLKEIITEKRKTETDL